MKCYIQDSAHRQETSNTGWGTTWQQATVGHKRQVPSCSKKGKRCYEISKEVLECNACASSAELKKSFYFTLLVDESLGDTWTHQKAPREQQWECKVVLKLQLRGRVNKVVLSRGGKRCKGWMLFYKTSTTRRESPLFQRIMDGISPNELIMGL